MGVRGKFEDVDDRGQRECKTQSRFNNGWTVSGCAEQRRNENQRLLRI